MPLVPYATVHGPAKESNRFIPDDSIKPPTLVLNLLHEKEDDIISCGHCRQPGAQLRCSRCKCVKYCSTTCQKDHFQIHKKNCKAIRKQYEQVNLSYSAEHVHPGTVFSAVEECVKMGDLLLKVGYQESDTIANGTLYYRAALKYFVMPMGLYKNNYHLAMGAFLENKVLLLISALGGEQETIKSWCTESYISGPEHDPTLAQNNPILLDKSNRSNYYERRKVLPEHFVGEEDGCALRGLTVNDTFFKFIYLFQCMKALALYRENLERINTLKEEVSVDDVSNNILPYLGVSDEGGEEGMRLRIRRTINAITLDGKLSCLVHLRDSIPFRREHAPDFFENSTIRTAPGPEYWMLLQDLFFETQGVNAILNEFVA